MKQISTAATAATTSNGQPTHRPSVRPIDQPILVCMRTDYKYNQTQHTHKSSVDICTGHPSIRQKPHSYSWKLARAKNKRLCINKNTVLHNSIVMCSFYNVLYINIVVCARARVFFFFLMSLIIFVNAFPSSQTITHRFQEKLTTTTAKMAIWTIEALENSIP